MKVLLDLHGFQRLHELHEVAQGDTISVPISLPLSGLGLSGDEPVDFESWTRPLFESATFRRRGEQDGVPLYRCIECRLCAESRERALIREVEARLAERIGDAIAVHRRLERKIARAKAQRA